VRFQAVIDGRSVEVEQVEGNLYRVNGVERQVDVVVLEPGLYSLIIDHASYEVSVREEKKATLVEVGAHLIPVKLQDPYASQSAGGKEALEGEVVISSPMPGRVVSIKAAVGQAVNEGEGIVVVEAMKMENELQSPKTGKVTQILVKVGDAVESGQDLVAVE